MKVHLTFDIEVWCGGWSELDARFPAAYARQVFGESRRGANALPATLQILREHGLRGVFFVEPLFSARFGAQFLRTIVELIIEAGQDVQLHLHPEWVDEIRPPPIANASAKRQHLCHYSAAEQLQLLRYAFGLLQPHAPAPVYAFRAGSYAANADTYPALRAAGLSVDSSLNRAFEMSGADVEDRDTDCSRIVVDGVRCYPVTVFRDGRARLRPAQVGACSLGEMQQALDRAHQAGRRHFVIVSHNFEMLKPGTAELDRIVQQRFRGLCQYLADHGDRFKVEPFAASGEAEPAGDAGSSPAVGAWPTWRRVVEQAIRRVV